MEYKTYRVFVVFVSLFFLLYFGFQLFRFFDNPKATEMAIPYSFTDSIAIEGIVLKEEQIIEETYGGVIQYQVPNAKKMKEKTPLAMTFPSQEDLVQSMRVADMKARIALLQEIEEQANDSVDQKKTRGSPPQNQLTALFAIESKQLDAISIHAEDFLVAMLQQQKILDPTISYIEEIDQLTKEIENASYQEGQTIYSPKDGFFTNIIDGYESQVTKQALEDLSLERVNELLALTPLTPEQDNLVGKVITDTRWYFIARVPTRSVERLSEGQVISLSFPENAQSPVRAQIQTIRIQPDHPQSTLLLHSDYLNAQTINLRKEKPEIVLGENTGIKVDRQALRMQGDQPGVYVNINDKPVFRRIQIIYSEDDFVVSSIEADHTYLQLYDELIVSN